MVRPCKKNGERCDRTKGNSFKVKNLGLDFFQISRKFLTKRVMRHWKRLPREIVDAPSSEVSKVR